MMLATDDRARLADVNAEVGREVFADAEALTVSECADRYRILPPTSPAAGSFRTDAIPYLRGIMDALGDPSKPEVVWAKASRVAGTTVGENYILYRMIYRPGGVLSVWPSEQKFKDWVSEKLDPMIDDSPLLRAKVGRERKDTPGGGRRDSGDTLHRKAFPGGWLVGITSRSVAQLKSLGAGTVIFEEPDEYVTTTQGDVIALGRVRAREHGMGRKIYINGTPTHVGASKVWAELEASTWNERWVPCPHCGDFQVLKWREGDGDDPQAGGYLMLWEKDADGWPIPGTARIACQHCGCEIEDRHKHDMDLAGEWRPRYPERVGVPGIAEGFHISAIYSPLVSWDELAVDFTKAARDPQLMKVFVNTVLGLPYSEGADVRLNPSFLTSRAERYQEDEAVWRALGLQRWDEEFNQLEPVIPHGVGLLTAGVDVQGDRVEGFLWGWGAGLESWFITWEVPQLDPADRREWPKLATGFLNRVWRHASGAPMRIACMAVDSAYNTDLVHSFCDQHERAFAVRGSSTGPGHKLLAAPDLNAKWRSTRRGQKKRPTYTVGGDTAKDELHGRLRILQPGPGYVHFPEELDPAFYDQLTAERLVTRYRAKRPFRTWEKIEGRANEALDGTVYARAALRKLEIANPRLHASLGEWAAQASDWKPTMQVAGAPRRSGRRVISKGIS